MEIGSCWRGFEIPKPHQDNPVCWQGLLLGHQVPAKSRPNILDQGTGWGPACGQVSGEGRERAEMGGRKSREKKKERRSKILFGLWFYFFFCCQKMPGEGGLCSWTFCSVVLVKVRWVQGSPGVNKCFFILRKWQMIIEFESHKSKKKKNSFGCLSIYFKRYFNIHIF